MNSFRTEISIQQELNITHQNKMMMFGSCFTENIGQKLIDHFFPVSCNPLGILFNPISIQQAIHRIIHNQKVKAEELFESDGVWNSFDFHSQFARLSKDEYLSNINSIIETAHLHLVSCDYIFITLGTSWIYEEIESNKVVANCHKVSPEHFNRRRISVSECSNVLVSILQELKAIKENIKIIFTVSPIRHWKDGAHGNQLSKSILLLSIDNICNNYSDCYYFPSYEIMMDDLRDYRFYADDMLHPSEQAQNYIWKRFEGCYFSDNTQQINRKIEQIMLALQHRPFNPESKGYQQFKEKTIGSIKQLQEEYPFLPLDKALSAITQIN